MIIAALIAIHLIITAYTLRTYYTVKVNYFEFSPFGKFKFEHLFFMLIPVVNITYLIEGLEAEFLGRNLK